ncbi:MAG: hypothetical protein IKM04_04525 [Clostridia bacterium]|nr:hypothetical protein [Clostridia bacterium]
MGSIELDRQSYRYLLDLVYVGNWILNSTRGNDRIEEYDRVESLIYSLCEKFGLSELAEDVAGEIVPSERYAMGGIHEAICDYEDSVFYDILAQELARRDLAGLDVDGIDSAVLELKVAQYMEEFAGHGLENISVRGF